MLYKLHTNIFIIGILTFIFMAGLVMDKAMSVITLGAFLAFITQMGLMLFYSQDEQCDYSERTLFETVLIYDVLVAICFMLISEYYEGDTFMFSKSDAMLYYDESMLVSEIGLRAGAADIVKKFAFDDWGAMFFDSFAMYIIPSKFFLNTIYTILGAISAVYLFRIAKAFMPDSYAFLASLGYSTSSFLIFFNCTFLKEPLFVFIVIATLYHIYQSIKNQSYASLLRAFFFLILQFFFRPAVAAFVLVSYTIYYAIIQKGNAISLFLYLIGGLVIAVSFVKMKETADAYTAGGDVDAVIAYRSNGGYSSSFNLFVSFFGAFLGPFPSLFSGDIPPSRLVFYGAGLTYKLFFAIPFWTGIFFALKKLEIRLIPLITFTVLEMTLTGYIMASLELRKVLLHIPFVFILSFYGLYHAFQQYRLSRITTMFSYAFVVGALFLWNVLKVK